MTQLQSIGNNCAVFKKKYSIKQLMKYEESGEVKNKTGPGTFMWKSVTFIFSTDFSLLILILQIVHTCLKLNSNKVHANKYLILIYLIIIAMQTTNLKVAKNFFMRDSLSPVECTVMLCEISHGLCEFLVKAAVKSKGLFLFQLRFMHACEI